ncbi:MAG: hypothetical protein Q8K24_11840 [Hydrogenophaga sp.]|nr:hypothetical protein [Hydrogenophaga sp.]
MEEPLDEPEPVRLPPLPVLLEPPVLPELPDMLEPMPEEPLPAEPAVEPLLEPIPALLPALEPEPLLMPEELVELVEPELPMELDAGDAAEEVEPGGVVPDGSEPGVDGVSSFSVQ